MKALLEKLKILEFKYSKLKENDTFNIFTVMFKESDEVKLHSQFLYTLLNPDGSHNKKHEFLKLFLDVLEVEEFDFEYAQVFKEYKGIDILIKNSNQAIILENKIWAGDQEKQIQRYIETILNEGVRDIKVIYLTLDGREPSDYSTGVIQDGIDIICVSYKNEIRNWIEDCIKQTALYPTLRETLNQYYKLISEITGMTMIKEELFEIMDVLSNNENIIQAHKIASNWNHIKWHTEIDFWTDFEYYIEKEFKIHSVQKYSEDFLDSVIHRSRNRNPFYGIMFEIFQKGTDKFCIYIERSFGDIYYGLTVLNEGNQRIKVDQKVFDKIADSLKSFVEWEREDWWLGGNYFEPPINFENFSNEETLKLINKEFRETYILKNWQDIKVFIEKCLAEIHKLNL